MTQVVTAIVRRAYGAPPLFAQAGTTEQEARASAWRTCRNTGVHGYRIDVVRGPWRPA